ncbi:hypothetical protein BN1723_015984, partial [Verticillium longisporum]
KTRSSATRASCSSRWSASWAISGRPRGIAAGCHLRGAAARDPRAWPRRLGARARRRRRRLMMTWTSWRAMRTRARRTRDGVSARATPGLVL